MDRLCGLKRPVLLALARSSCSLGFPELLLSQASTRMHGTREGGSLTLDLTSQEERMGKTDRGPGEV